MLRGECSISYSNLVWLHTAFCGATLGNHGLEISTIGKAIGEYAYAVAITKTKMAQTYPVYTSHLISASTCSVHAIWLWMSDACERVRRTLPLVLAEATQM